MHELIQSETIYEPSPKVVPRRVKDRLIIVPIEDGVADFNNAMYSFNETGTRVWECIEQKQDMKTICDILAHEYDADKDRIKQTVSKLITTLLEKGIIIQCPS